MNIIYKLGYKKHYIGSYLLSFVAIGFYLSLYLSENLYGFLEIKTVNIFNKIPFFDFRLFLFVLAVSIIAVVFFIFSSIKCPKCGYKIFWNWFNDSRTYRDKGNPLTISVCPNCNYDPDQEK